MWHRRPRSDQCHLCSSVVKGFVFQLSLFGNFGDFGNLVLCVPPCPLWLKVFSSCFFVSFVVKVLEYLSQLNHLQRTILPVMLPAHNRVTAVYSVSVPHEIPALKFKFKFHPLQLPACHLPERLAVGEGRLESQHAKS